MTTLLLHLNEEAVSAEELSEISALVPKMEIVHTRDKAEITSLLEDVEIVAGGISPELVLQMPNLQWVQQWSAGVDEFVTYPGIAEKDFTLTNASGVHSIPISEHILAFLFAFARNLHCAMREQVNHTWINPPEPCNPDVFELAGRTMVLVGVGAIGERTAQMAAALGMRVLGVRNNPETGAAGVAAMYGPDELLEILPEADVVVLTVPLTEATRHMIGEEELHVMKPTAIIINIGRGGTIDEDALITALREGRIGGAGLDVFETEPLPETSPLWEMRNVIITSHYAGHTPYYDARALSIFMDNLRRYASGASLNNVVDMDAGY